MGVLSVRLRRWHRRLSWLAGVALILWAGSGLLHPVMSWTNPRPAASAPPVAEVLPRPARTLAQVTSGGLASARLLQQQGRLLWQLRKAPDASPEYYDASTGLEQAGADRERALWLARHYTGREAVADAQQLTAFDADYPAINRLLPVWCVRFEGDDALTACVHTVEDRLATLSDRRKRALQTVFQAVHTLDFLDRHEGLRLGFVFAAVGSVLAMAMLGSGLLLGRRTEAGTGARRGHRALAWVVWLPVLMLSASGLFHLLVLSPLRAPPEPVRPLATVDVKSLAPLPADFQGARELSLIALPQGGAAWRLRYEPGDLRVYDAIRLQPYASGDAALAIRLAGVADDTPVAHLLKFSPEYGFANKRLPVWRVETAQGLLFVDTAAGLIAARVNAVDAAELWSFSTLHKWQFLDPLGRLVRDGLLSLAALLAIAAAVFGFLLLRRRRVPPLPA